MDGCPACRQPNMVIETSIFIETPFLSDCEPMIKNDSPAHEMENILWSLTRRCPVKKFFLKISLNPQENTCTGASF